MQDFEGIAAKLERAEKNIENLYSEMARFFEESDYPVFPEHDRELLAKAVEYHKNLVIPPRFSVLTGEIVHHLRSCFDHVVWHFSVLPVKNPKQIDFPVFDLDPFTDKYRRKRFEGKIAGIVDAKVLALINRLQPYKAADPTDDPLWLIHDFDIIDKHKELILCVGTPSVFISRDMEGVLESYQRAHPELNPAQVTRHFKGNAPTVPCISFRNFGRRKVEPVSEGLIKLFNYTFGVINEFRVI